MGSGSQLSEENHREAFKEKCYRKANGHTSFINRLPLCVCLRGRCAAEWLSDCAISRSIVSIVYSVNNQFIYELHNGTKSTRSQQKSTVFAAYTLSYHFVNQLAVGVPGFCRIIEPLKVLAFLQASYHPGSHSQFLQLYF